MNKWKRIPFRGLSIQQRLPLLICVLLLAVMITFSWASYMSVKKASLKAGRERLHSLTDQLATVLSQSAQAFITASRNTAAQPAIKKCLGLLDAGTCLEAQGILDKLRQDTMSILTDLIDTKRRHILRSGKDFIQDKVNFDSLLSANMSLPRDTGSFGKIYKIRDSLYYPIVVSVTDNQQLIGYLVRWRMISGNPKSIEQFSQLLGTKAALYVGNSDGSVWSNMVNPVENPLPENVRPVAEIAEYSHGRNNRVMAAERPIKNTQWSILIEFSQRTVLESANTFLTRIIILGSVLMIIGMVVAWIMSRNITRPLKKLTVAVSAIASGTDFPEVEVDRRDEVGKLARAFNAMSVQVQNAKKELELKVVEAEKISEQLRDLSAHLQNIREQERIHIAREMHDELGQLLTGFKMDVSWLNKKLAGVEDPAIQERLSSLLTLTDEAVSFVRKVAAELRPSVLDDLGLVAALEWQSKEFQKRFNIEVDFNSKTEDINTSELIATGLFRMYQESLTNVARHSGAQKVVSNLQNTTRQICLSITDDGKGFAINGNGERKTLGLLGMKERALMIGGNLEILSEPGKGTTVIITVPLN